MSMVGLTHRGATLPLLEQVSVPRGERGRLLAALRAAGYSEAVVLSTCSRIEIYAGPDAGGPEGLLTVLGGHSGLSLVELHPAAEMRDGHAVVEHLFRVAAGMESRVVGEIEIHGQVRSAFREAQAAGMTGSALGRLFPAALRCGSRVRAETTLGAQGRSLGHRAVDVGLAALGDVVDPAIMVVGSGRMAGSAVEHLTRLGRRPLVAARNEIDAARLAGPGRVCPLPALATGVEQADLLICATSAAYHVVTFDHVREAMSARSRRPLIVVDLSVPRNVDTAVATVPGVRLIDLEGMNDDATADPALAAALEAAAALVSEASQRHTESVAARRAGPVIAALRRQVEATCLVELTRVAPRTTEPEDLASAARAVAGKLLHRPTIAAREAAAAGDTDALSSLCDIFGVQLSDVVASDADGLRRQTRIDELDDASRSRCVAPRLVTPASQAPAQEQHQADNGQSYVNERREGVQAVKAADSAAPAGRPYSNGRAAGSPTTRPGTPRRGGAQSPVVEVVGLVKRYGDVLALDGVSLDVAAGCVLALLGPNGAGKTSAVEICEGFRRPDAGRVRVLGLDPHRDARDLRPRVGVMLQGGGAYPAARCGEMLRLVASFARHPHDPGLLLEALGLASATDTPVKRLSGGQRQRLSLAMAIVGRPELVFLDEPTAGLDPAARHATWEVVEGLRRDGATVVLTTHFMDEAERLADAVVVLDHGQIVAQGSPSELTRAGMTGQVRFQAPAGLDMSTLAGALPGGGLARELGPGQYLVESAVDPGLLATVAGWCAQQNVLAEDMQVQRRSLEDVFLDLTGRDLRS